MEVVQMKKNGVVVMALLVFSMVFVGVNAQAQGCCGSGNGIAARQGWGTDPENDPVYKQFQEDTAKIRKQIAMDRAELNAVMAAENPDNEKAKEVSGRLFDNQQKLAQLTRESGFGGPGAGGGCGGCGGGGRAYYRGCPGAGGAGNFQGGSGYYCPSCNGPGTGPGAVR